MGVQQLITWIAGQHDLTSLAIACALAVLAVLALVKLVGLVRRLVWSVGLLIVAGAVGGGEGWNRLHALTQLR
jgi:hypothetical protein